MASGRPVARCGGLHGVLSLSCLFPTRLTVEPMRIVHSRPFVYCCWHSRIIPVDRTTCGPFGYDSANRCLSRSLAMRSSKGALAANTAILSLFLDGPESLANIRGRMRRDYANARWSRSVVDAAVPALLDDELIALVHAAEKPAQRIYEITERGADVFREWVRESAMAPAPIREPLQLWIERSTPD